MLGRDLVCSSHGRREGDGEAGDQLSEDHDRVFKRFAGEGPSAIEAFQQHRSLTHISRVQANHATAVPYTECSRFGSDIVAGRRQSQYQRLLAPTHWHHESIRTVHDGPVHAQAPIPALSFHSIRQRVQPLAAG
jgi:hypothetical protein